MMAQGIQTNRQGTGSPVGSAELTRLPLVVDLDGTLTPSDTLVESVIRLVKHRPWSIFRVILWLLLGRARFKARVAASIQVPPARLPWREDFIAYLRAEHASGRRLILATASHASVAEAVAAHFGFFDAVLASHGATNLKGSSKLEAIREFVHGPFVYAGDSRADLAVWRGAAGAVLVGASPSVTAAVTVPVECRFEPPTRSWKTWLRAIRVHQWVKNSLLFVPLFTAFSLDDWRRFAAVIVAFVAFSLAASATYIFNDLWDLDNDRAHPRKRLRAFASAQLSLFSGVTVAAAFLGLAFALSLLVSLKFSAMLAGYVVLTTVYSLVLKQYVLLDVLVLAGLYTWRVLTGSIAVAIPVSPWLLAFSVFTFFSLALVKRCAELLSMQERGITSASGRDYSARDLVVLWPLGVGSSLCSVVVFGLFVGSPGAEMHYGRVELLWTVGFCLLYWIARLWVKTARGEMHDDPIVFALSDFGSRVAIFAMIFLTIVAHIIT